jgi:DNA-binding helix-hairpin-helix protein with protein kinase domain
MKQLHATLLARRLNDYLDRHYIRSAKIAGIGEQRKQTLASFGIETAADITLSSIAAVPGIGTGLTANLMAWKKSIEQRFVPPSSISPGPQDVSAVNARIAGLRARLEQKLRDGATHLQSVRNEVVARQNNAKGTLEVAYQALAQAKADLDVLQRTP